jgi:hypothetical protein
MKAQIQFITKSENYYNSPLLEVYVPSKTALKKFLETFKPKHRDPAEVMVDFIIFAHSAIKTVAIRNLEDRDYSQHLIAVEVRSPNIVEFVYKKDDGKTDWRKVDILEEDKYYVKGHDLNDNNSFKCFKKCNIVGGRIIKQ